MEKTGRLEVTRDDEHKEAEKLIAADREHLSSHTLAGQFMCYLHSQNIVGPGLNKHGPRGRHKLVFFFFLCIASHCLPATCANKWRCNIC